MPRPTDVIASYVGRSPVIGVKVGASTVQAGSGADWTASLPALRSFITANYNQPNPHNQTVMPSPPTVTTSTAAETATYSVVKECADQPTIDATILIEGGKPAVAASVFQQPFAANQNVSTTVKVASRISVNVNADAVAFYVVGTTLAFRFLVDDRYVSLAGTVPAATTGTGNNYIILTFGSKAVRKVTIELQQNCSVRRIAVKPADSFLAKPAARAKRGIVLGDSITAATGATAFGDGFVTVAGDMLGTYDLWPSGVGSTGYVNTFGATRFKLSERLSDANTTGPWDIIDVAMGINDVGFPDAEITAEVSICINSLRANNPTAQIFVTGPWDAAAPGAPSAGYLACKAAIIAGIPAGAGVTFLDPQGVAYTKVDAVHPDTPGHKTLGDWKALQIKTAIGA